MAEKIKYLILSGRPKQWTKNLVFFAAIIFSGKLTDIDLLARTILAFTSLCFLTSSVYILNDLIDVKKDRYHPKKKNRPIAAGKISIKLALAGLFIFFLISLVLGLYAGTGYLLAAGAYLVLQLFYGLFLKNIVLLDIISIAAGFVIRAVAGVLTIEVSMSPWLLVCAALLALFLASAKRRHEILLLGNTSNFHRPVLNEYSAELIDEMMATLSAATITTYSLYTFFLLQQEQEVR